MILDRKILYKASLVMEDGKIIKARYQPLSTEITEGIEGILKATLQAYGYTDHDVIVIPSKIEVRPKKIYAVYIKSNNNKEGLIKNQKYEIIQVNMGQSSTYLTLDNVEYAQNSVMFHIIDEDGNDYDIFNDPVYNPYI